MSEEGLHSPRGPSAAHRWRNCAGSINAERGLPDKAGIEAARGTVFHDYAAMCLQFGLDPEDFPLGVKHQQDGYEIEFDDDMVRHMRPGLDWIRDQIEPGDIVLIEQQVDISPWVGEGEFGTLDVCIIKVAKRQIINFDWKYGSGVPVSPVENDQMYLYGLGAWQSFAQKIFGSADGIEVTFYVEQPRAPGGGGEWKTTMKKLLKEGASIRIDAEATKDPNAPRTPGEKQCHFCKASGNCPEQDDYMMKVMGQKFADIDEGIETGLGPAFDDPHELVMARRVYVLLHWKAFKRYVDRIHALVLHDLKAGETVPLLKVVEGRAPHRKYRDDELPAVKELLVAELGAEKALVVQPISPAVAEKELGRARYKEKLKPYVEQGQGKPILVPLTDKREPMQNYAEKFDEIGDEEDDEI